MANTEYSALTASGDSTTYDSGLSSITFDIYGSSDTNKSAWTSAYSSSESTSLLDLPELQIVDSHQASNVVADVEESIAKAEQTAADNSIDVKAGDTVWALARRALEGESGVKPSNKEILEMVNAIAALNDMEDPNRIRTGQRLQLPPKKDA